MDNDNIPKPFECEVHGMLVTGTVQRKFYAAHDYAVTAKFGNMYFMFDLVQTATEPARHSVGYIKYPKADHTLVPDVTPDQPREYIFIRTRNVGKLFVEQAFEAALYNVYDIYKELPRSIVSQP